MASLPNNLSSLPQIYVGGKNPPPDRLTGGLSGVKRQPAPPYKSMSPAKSRNMLNKARQGGDRPTPSRMQGVI